MRDSLELKNESNLRECFPISQEREEELMQYIKGFGNDLNYIEFLGKIWNDCTISDEEIVLIIIGLGQRIALSEITLQERGAVH